MFLDGFDQRTLWIYSVKLAEGWSDFYYNVFIYLPFSSAWTHFWDIWRFSKKCWYWTISAAEFKGLIISGALWCMLGDGGRRSVHPVDVTVSRFLPSLTDLRDRGEERENEKLLFPFWLCSTVILLLRLDCARSVWWATDNYNKYTI